MNFISQTYEFSKYSFDLSAFGLYVPIVTYIYLNLYVHKHTHMYIYISYVYIHTYSYIYLYKINACKLEYMQ